MDADVARPLAGSEAADGLTPPMFWSPDSQSIAFYAAGELKRIDVQGGAPRTVCALPNGSIGGSWNADDVIVVGQLGGLLRCPAAGGPASEVTRLDATKGESAHLLPSFLPDGRHFLYLSVSRMAPSADVVRPAWHQDWYRWRRESLFRRRHFTGRLAGCHGEAGFPAEHRPGHLDVRFISSDDDAGDF